METPRFEMVHEVPPDAWANVDELELQRIAIKLATGGIDPSAQDAEKERVRSPTFAAHHTDPLGLGRLNPRTLRLLRSETDEGIRSMPQVLQQNEFKHQEILLTMDGFDPYKFLAHVHCDSSLSELQHGVKNLQSELQQQTGELKQLVKENFERFISCKSTIDDVHSKLVAGEDSHEGKGGTSGVLANHVREVRLSALDAFDPIIKRHVQSLRVRNVVNLLDRFHYLFQIPATVRKHAQEGDLEGVVSEYANGKKILLEAEDTIWESLLQELESVVREEADNWVEQLHQTDIETKLATRLVVNLIALKKLGATSLENISPLKIFVETQKNGVDESIAIAFSKLENAKQNTENKPLIAYTFSRTLSRSFSRQLSLFGSLQMNEDLLNLGSAKSQYDIQFVEDILSSLQSWVPKVFVVCRAAKQQAMGEEVICKMFDICWQHINSSLQTILGENEDELFFGGSREVVDALLHFLEVAQLQADEFPEKLCTQLTDILELAITNCVENYAHRLPRISTLLSSDEQTQITTNVGCLKQLRSGSLVEVESTLGQVLDNVHLMQHNFFQIGLDWTKLQATLSRGLQDCINDLVVQSRVTSLDSLNQETIVFLLRTCEQVEKLQSFVLPQLRRQFESCFSEQDYVYLQSQLTMLRKSIADSFVAIQTCFFEEAIKEHLLRLETFDASLQDFSNIKARPGVVLLIDLLVQIQSLVAQFFQSTSKLLVGQLVKNLVQSLNEVLGELKDLNSLYWVQLYFDVNLLFQIFQSLFEDYVNETDFKVVNNGILWQISKSNVIGDNSSTEQVKQHLKMLFDNQMNVDAERVKIWFQVY